MPYEPTSTIQNKLFLTRRHEKEWSPSRERGRPRPLRRRAPRFVVASFALACRVLCAADADAQPAARVKAVVRILPQTVDVRNDAFLIGLTAGCDGGAARAVRAERLPHEIPEAELRSSCPTGGAVRISVSHVPGETAPFYTVVNNSDTEQGVTLLAQALRQGVPHTLSVICRSERDKTRLTVGFQSAADPAAPETFRRARIPSGSKWNRHTLTFTPDRDGTFRLRFLLEPGGIVTFARFSLMPADADENGWDPVALEALRVTAAPFLFWPVCSGSGFYNWYDGVGPQAAREAKGQAFGTVEAVRLSRLSGAEPVFRISLFAPEDASEATGIPRPAAAAELAADWVAYCNATGSHPLAMLRTRHGVTEPLGVRRWELCPAGGLLRDPSAFARESRRVADAMRAEDATLTLQIRPALTNAYPVSDPYTGRLLKRLESADAAEREYYRAWYEALGPLSARLDLRAAESDRDNTAPLAFTLPDVLCRNVSPPACLTGPGLLMTLLNRFPLAGILATEGAPPTVRILAGWGEDDSVLLLFVCNTGTEAQTLHFDLRALRRRFMFYTLDQAAAEITLPRLTPVLPIRRHQKAGAALTQFVVCEAAPSSFTRILVTE